MTTFVSNPNVKEGIILNLLKDFRTRYILDRPDYDVHQSLDPFSLNIDIGPEGFCWMYSFDDQVANNILYALEIEKRFPVVYNKLSASVNAVDKYQYKKEIGKLSVHEMLQISPDCKLFYRAKELFPTLPVYTVPGVVKNPPKKIITFFPFWYGDGFHYALLKYLEGKGCSGSTVLVLPMGEVSNLVYTLVYQNEVDVFINFYENAMECNDWYYIEQAMRDELKTNYAMANDLVKDFVIALKKVPKNYKPGPVYNTGINFTELEKVF